MEYDEIITTLEIEIENYKVSGIIGSQERDNERKTSKI
jgi:hypothetical protein